MMTAYRQGYLAAARVGRPTLRRAPRERCRQVGESWNLIPFIRAEGVRKMQQSIPAANTFADAYPNSKKIFDETFVDTPHGAVTIRVPLREVT